MCLLVLSVGEGVHFSVVRFFFWKLGVYLFYFFISISVSEDFYLVESGVREGQLRNSRSFAIWFLVVSANVSNLCNSCKTDWGGPVCSKNRGGGLIRSICSMLRARESITYRWSQ